MTPAGAVQSNRVAGFGLTTPDAARLAAFYVAAFGCRRGPSERLGGPAFEHVMGVASGAECTRLTLGEEFIDLLQFDRPGAPYPIPETPLARTFQHFALVVTDMHRALQRLSATPGWTPISSGPQRLPASSGGVTAFKFRDPDGHPLEFLEFSATEIPARWQSYRVTEGDGSPHADAPTAGIIGIDHSAISVTDAAASIAFYRGLGFAPSAQTWNHGEEQSALDGIPDPRVEVTALTIPSHSAPHLELLCYQSDSRQGFGAARGNGATAANDVAATRIVIATGNDMAGEAMLRDPDGHRLHLVADGGPTGHSLPTDQARAASHAEDLCSPLRSIAAPPSE